MTNADGGLDSTASFHVTASSSCSYKTDSVLIPKQSEKSQVPSAPEPRRENSSLINDQRYLLVPFQVLVIPEIRVIKEQ